MSKEVIDFVQMNLGNIENVKYLHGTKVSGDVILLTWMEDEGGYYVSKCCALRVGYDGTEVGPTYNLSADYAESPALISFTIGYDMMCIPMKTYSAGDPLAYFVYVDTSSLEIAFMDDIVDGTTGSQPPVGCYVSPGKGVLIWDDHMSWITLDTHYYSIDKPITSRVTNASAFRTALQYGFHSMDEQVYTAIPDPTLWGLSPEFNAIPLLGGGSYNDYDPTNVNLGAVTRANRNGDIMVWLYPNTDGGYTFLYDQDFGGALYLPRSSTQPNLGPFTDIDHLVKAYDGGVMGCASINGNGTLSLIDFNLGSTPSWTDENFFEAGLAGSIDAGVVLLSTTTLVTIYYVPSNKTIAIVRRGTGIIPDPPIENNGPLMPIFETYWDCSGEVTTVTWIDQLYIYDGIGWQPLRMTDGTDWYEGAPYSSNSG